MWIWAAGEQTAAADFGDPVGADDYTLCVYDRLGPPAARLLLESTMMSMQPSGSTRWAPAPARSPAARSAVQKQRTHDRSAAAVAYSR